jgi:hypothetical protein
MAGTQGGMAKHEMKRRASVTHEFIIKDIYYEENWIFGTVLATCFTLLPFLTWSSQKKYDPKHVTFGFNAILDNSALLSQVPTQNVQSKVSPQQNI